MHSSALIKLSTLLTAAGFLPSVAAMIYCAYNLGMRVDDSKEQSDDTKPSAHRPALVLPLLPYTLLTAAMSFFLFSFQVHEKTILVPLLPLTLLLSGAASDSFTFQLGALVNNVAVFR